MRHTFRSEQWIPYSLDVVFAFFATPENLPRLMLPWQDARIEALTIAPPPPRAPGSMPVVHLFGVAAGQGTRMTLSFRPFPWAPFRLKWVALIDEFVWNEHFCDSQLRGPFAFWHHCHRLERQSRPRPDGTLAEGTLLRDEVVYEMRFGLFGQIAHSLFVVRQFEKIFAFRHKRTAELLPLMLPRIGAAI